MKLLFCPRCHDIIKLRYTQRHCMCGLCSGYYESDGHSAVIINGVGIGISNPSFMQALHNRPESETDYAHRNTINNFEAWVSPIKQPRITQQFTGEDVYKGTTHVERVAIKKQKIIQSGITLCGINFHEHPDIRWNIEYGKYFAGFNSVASHDDIINMATRPYANVCPHCLREAKRFKTVIKRAATVYFKNF